MGEACKNENEKCMGDYWSVFQFSCSSSSQRSIKVVAVSKFNFTKNVNWHIAQIRNQMVIGSQGLVAWGIVCSDVSLHKHNIISV